jgi:hypothetical protein
MRTQNPAPPVEEAQIAPGLKRRDAAVIAQYIQDLTRAS